MLNSIYITKIAGIIFSAILFCVSYFPNTTTIQEEYASRRFSYQKHLKEEVSLIFNYDFIDLKEYVPDKNFFYLTGCEEPGAVLLLSPGKKFNIETLFLPIRDLEQERWTGSRMAPNQETAEKLGIRRVLSTKELRTELSQLRMIKSKVYTNLSVNSEKTLAGQTYSTLIATIKKWFPKIQLLDASSTLGLLRMEKSKLELEKMKKAVKITVEAHREAAKTISSGKFEYQVEAIIEFEFRNRGATRPAFPSIIASGPNSTTLHYRENKRQMQSGDLVIIDVGAEFENYSADLTRTYPVDGHFTNRQREIYNVVLGAQEAALKQLRPGIRLGQNGAIQQAAYQYINNHGRDSDGQRLGRYFIHGISHHVGLEVHDLESQSSTLLKPGMVITIEPGIYIPQENLGIRIEDEVLITDNGYQMLSSALPRDSVEIEQLMLEK